MGCKQLWYQHAFHVKQGHGGAWCVHMCMCVSEYLCVSACVCACLHNVLFDTFSQRGVCVLSVSLGVRPEGMSNWNLHTSELDSR